MKQNTLNSPSKKYSIVSLFAGCGGMDLGFIKEGFHISWANDNNKWACKTYKENFGHEINSGDIEAVDLTTIPKADIVLGGFPCQDFSVIWKRGGISTDRGNLYQYLVKTVDTINPKIFIAENVKGLLSANGRDAINRIKDDFSICGEHGYNTDIHLVNFADYGTPQLRERVLIVGVRSDLGLKFKLPDKTHNPSSYVTSKQALKGVEKAKYNNQHHNIAEKTKIMLELIPPGGNFSNIPKNSQYYVKGMISHVYRRLHPDKPATTIIAGGGGGTWGYHYSEPRALTNRERARLFGFPDDFIFYGSITEVRRQIGNAVPPVGIQPIAKQIKHIIKGVQ
ncbi:MAG: DNA cytosine methyltransferase [Thermodesulfobacteriota bacterium]